MLPAMLYPINIEGNIGETDLLDRWSLVDIDGTDQEQSIRGDNYTIYQGTIIPDTYYVYPNYQTFDSYILDTLWGDDDPLTGGQCVAYIQYKTGAPYTGNAITWQEHINSSIPEIGSIIVTTHSYWGHIGEVIYIDYGNRRVLIESRNFRDKYIVSQDWLDISDSQILGYIIL